MANFLMKRPVIWSGPQAFLGFRFLRAFPILPGSRECPECSSSLDHGGEVRQTLVNTDSNCLFKIIARERGWSGEVKGV